MANRYWVGGTGNWSDTAHWSASSGGTGGVAKPTSTDNVYFDANSFSGIGQTVTVDEEAYCADLDWTGAANNPAFARTVGFLFVYGSVTFIAAMNYSYSSELFLYGSGKSIATNGLTTNTFRFANNCSYTFQDNWSCSAWLGLDSGTVNTNGKNIICSLGLAFQTAGAKTLILGGSTLTIGALVYTGSNATLSPNTATINCSGNFSGGGISTYQTVNLTGPTSTISGSNTFARLALSPGITQTITFTDGTTQTIANPRLSGSSGHIHTLQGSGTGGWALAMPAGFVGMDYLAISRSTVSPAGAWYAGAHATDGGNNTGWVFGDLTAVPPAATLDAVAPAPTPGAAASRPSFSSTSWGASWPTCRPTLTSTHSYEEAARNEDSL